MTYPSILDGKAKVYEYQDVELEKTTRAAVPYAKTGDPVTFQMDGDVMKVVQEGHVIGQMKPTRLVSMIQTWAAAGDPVLANLASYLWTGAKGTISLAFYRDELSRLRQRDDAIMARIGKPEPWLNESVIGSRLDVFLDEDTGRYELILDHMVVGLLPMPVVDQIHANSLEPEDAAYYLDHAKVDEDIGRVDWYVIIV